MVNLLWLLVVVTTLAPTLGGQTHRRRSLRPSALSLLASAVAAPPTATTDGTRPSSKKSDDEEHDEEDDDDDINPSPGSGVATSLSTRSNAAHNQATKIKVAAPRNKKEAAVAPLDDATADDDDDDADGKESPPSPSPFALLGNPLVKQFAPTAVYMLASRVIMKLNFLDPAVVQICRAVFAVYLVLSQLLFAVLRRRIEAADDQSPVAQAGPLGLPADALKGLGDAAGGAAGGPLGGLLASALGGGAAAAKAAMTAKEYDLQELRKMSSAVFFEAVCASYLHFITKAVKPLLFMPLMGVMNKLQSQMVQIHLLGSPAVGDLQRPFRSGMEKMMEGLAKGAAAGAAGVVAEGGGTDGDVDDGSAGAVEAQAKASGDSGKAAAVPTITVDDETVGEEVEEEEAEDKAVDVHGDAGDGHGDDDGRQELASRLDAALSIDTD